MRKAFPLFLLAFQASVLFSATPVPFTRVGFGGANQRSLSDVNYVNLKSSVILTSNDAAGQGIRVQISSGVTRLEFAFVSSSGSNSEIQILDSRIFDGMSLGNSTITVASDRSNVSNLLIPYNYESSTQGIVIISTCIVCAGAAWTTPTFRVSGERIR